MNKFFKRLEVKAEEALDEFDELEAPQKIVRLSVAIIGLIVVLSLVVAIARATIPYALIAAVVYAVLAWKGIVPKFWKK